MSQPKFSTTGGIAGSGSGKGENMLFIMATKWRTLTRDNSLAADQRLGMAASFQLYPRGTSRIRMKMFCRGKT